MHPLTPHSCPLCYIPILTSAEHYIPFPYIYMYISSNFAHYINYQRKLVKCIPKFMCSEVSVFKKNFLSNRSLLYCIISLSKTTLPSFAFKKFSHDKLIWSNSGVARRKENVVNQRKKSIQ